MHTFTDLLFDVDGVFADYSGEYRRLSGADPAEKGKLKAQRFRQMPHFYRNLPLLPNAMKLWNFGVSFCQEHKLNPPKFLTASSNYQSTSKEDKHQWIGQHFHVHGEERVIVVRMPTDKWKYAGPGRILVDDTLKNCHELVGHNPTKHVVEAFMRLEGLETPVTANLVETFGQIWKMIETGQDLTEILGDSPTEV
jgi:hypothetical protein